MRRRKYLVVYERQGRSYGAFVPDLPGCVAVAPSLSRVKQLIREAIELHLEDMTARGQRVPTPTSESDYVVANLN
jgi:predicted RNase H-like HicB family nuclease